MNRTLGKLALGISLALLTLPSDVLAGRGGGRGGGGGGGGMGRSPMGNSPSFSSPRPPSSQGRPQSGNMGSEGRPQSGNTAQSGTRNPSGSNPGTMNRGQAEGNNRSNDPNAGAAAAGAGYSNRNQPNHPDAAPAAAGAGAANRNQPNHPDAAPAAAGAGYANRNQPNHPDAAPAAAGAGYANRNQPNYPNAGAAAAGAGYANRNQPNYPNAGAAAAGAGYANRNQPNYPNAGAAAAGAGYANRNQPNYPNAGAAAAGAGYANRNQPNYPNAGAAAVGAGYANRNQPNYPNAGAAAVGAGYANRNQYNQYHPGMVNGYWNGNNSAAWGATGAGLGYASGVGAWGAGSPMYSWGYSGYGNPYSGTSAGSVGAPQQLAGAAQPAAAPAAYNYAQPISTTAASPEPSVADQATSAFDQARGAFKGGDYTQALQLVQQALTQMPNDTMLHEFLALVLFAQGNYEQAAAPLYAVLSVGPGWDWTTLSGMYPDVDTYTRQLRSLEAYLKTNPKSAQGRFVLAYQYLCEGHVEDAVAELKQVVELQPGDALSAQLLAHFQPAGGTPPAPAVAAAGNLVGNWAAAPVKDAKIALAIRDDGRFTWAATNPGKPPMSIAGNSTFADGLLTLTDQGGQNGALVGQVAWQDDNHFTFRVQGAPQDDPGLKFAR